MRKRSAGSGERGSGVERVAARVRGYCGYLETRSRRASDLALRRFAGEHLDRAAGAVLASAKEAPAAERDRLREVARGLERTRAAVGAVAAACSDFLDAGARVAPEAHDLVCAIDERIADSARALAVTAEAGDYLASDLATELRRLERALRARARAMGGATAPTAR